MTRSGLLTFFLTKRGVVVGLVAITAVLGAGFGFVFPALQPSPDVDEASPPPTDTPATTADTTTVSRPDGSTTSTDTSTSETTTEATPTTSEDARSPPDERNQRTGSPPRNDGASVDVQAESNATIASVRPPTRAEAACCRT
ncbi:hypothetical protein [Haladaptatus sp. NG-WS-4]